MPPHVLVPRDIGVPLPGRDALGVADRREALSVARALALGESDPAFRPAVADGVALQAGLGLLLHRGLPLESLPGAFTECREVLAAGFAFPLPDAEVKA
jgi:hypothetical protein